MSRAHHSPDYHRNARIVRRTLTPKIAAGAFVPCVECGRAVVLGQRWDVGHKTSAARGGSNALSNLGAAHRRCNRSNGGKAGAAARHTASRRARRLPTKW